MIPERVGRLFVHVACLMLPMLAGTGLYGQQLPQQLPAGTAGTQWLDSLEVTFDSSYTPVLPYTACTVVSGALPPGVHLQRVPKLLLSSGEPTLAGNYSFSLTVTDSARETSVPLAFAITPSIRPLPSLRRPFQAEWWVQPIRPRP